MCTATWYFTADGYELFFNRDELRTRKIAEPPTQASTRQVDYLAPTDSDAGGTWLAVSRQGVAVGLLNNAQPAATQTEGSPVSRGRLVRELADLDSPDDLAARFERLGFRRLQPFTVFALAPGGHSAVIDFDGSALASRTAGDPAILSSSSIDSGGAAEPRRLELVRRLTLELDPTASRLEFHRSHEPERGPLSPCMHREDARTVSFCHLQVDSRQARFAYLPGPPCGRAEAVNSLIEINAE